VADEVATQGWPPPQLRTPDYAGPAGKLKKPAKAKGKAAPAAKAEDGAAPAVAAE